MSENICNFKGCINYVKEMYPQPCRKFPQDMFIDCVIWRKEQENQTILSFLKKVREECEQHCGDPLTWLPNTRLIACPDNCEQKFLCKKPPCDWIEKELTAFVKRVMEGS